MASVTVTFFGPPEQRHVVKLTPMTPLSSAFEEACAKFKLNAASGEYALQIGKKPLDLSLAYRFANIPANGKLEIVKVQTPAQGSGPAQRLSRPVSSQADSSRRTDGTGAHIQRAPASTPESGGSTAEGTNADMFGGRPVYVFTQRTLEEKMSAGASQGARVDDESDSFFEFTQEDFAAVMHAANKRKQVASSGLRTAAMREAEQHAKAAALGPVPVRVHFPDGHILQSAFSATETVSAIYELVSQCLSEAAQPGFYLYTTPPRTPLKDQQQTIYHAGLVPAAHVYFHADDKAVASGFSGPYLSPAVLALMTDHLPEGLPTRTDQQEASPPAAAVTAPSGSASRPTQQAPSAAGGSKAPKWLKLGAR